MTREPSSARMYDYILGGKDNLAVDRETVQAMAGSYPGTFDAVRDNRRFLYRVTRFLAGEAGIRQFLDLGSGLPTQHNVHEVARQLRPDAGVVYVDNDPVVLAHGRALLATDERTTVTAGDLTAPDQLLADVRTHQLLDLSEPIGVLLLSVTHWLADDAAVQKLLASLREAMAPGSYLGFSQMVGADRAAAEEANERVAALGMAAKNRTPEDVRGFLADLEPVAPGLVDVRRWRPDPDQPPLPEVDEPLRPFLGASDQDQRFMEFGGVARRP